MSELKDYDIMDIEAMDDERLEKSESGKIQVTRVYIKSEADKVFVELKAQKAQAEDDCAYWKTMAQKNAADNAVMAKQRAQALKRESHHKYKRCLAMAKWCASERDIYNLTPRFAKMNFYTKWRKRWLKIAEQFKEAK